MFFFCPKNLKKFFFFFFFWGGGGGWVAAVPFSPHGLYAYDDDGADVNEDYDMVMMMMMFYDNNHDNENSDVYGVSRCC